MKTLFKSIVLLVFCYISPQAFAVDCSTLNIWQSTTIYLTGNQVQYNAKAYQANWWTQNQNPETHSGQWQEWTLQGDCDGNGGTNQSPIANANGPYTGITNNNISFSSSGSSDPDGSVSSYQWNFGDGTSSSQSDPVHSYSSAGVYSVTLTVTDNEGASNSASTTATISDDNGGGNDCPLPQYVAGTNYSIGDEVKNIGRSYRCDISGWCSSTAAWAYEPGVGAHWQQAWTDTGICDDNSGGENQAPIADINGPYSGSINNTIYFSSAGSNDPDGTITNYLWNFGDGSSSTLSDPTHGYANAGTYTVTLTVTDNENATASASTNVIVSGDGGGNELPHRLLIGYWHNFDNGSGYIKMQDVISDWDIINVSFAENKPGGAEGEVAFAPFGESESDFIAGVRLQQSSGKKVLISLGGANAHIQLNTLTARDNFVRTMGEIIARYGFDGMDIDLEGGSLNMNPGDTIANPQTPAIVNLISATRSLKSQFGSNFVLTMAPETAYVQGGLTTFGGIWGAYLPLIHALRDDLTVLHVQHYNTGSLTGTDGKIYQPGTADFHVAMSDMLLTGFNAAGNASNHFPALRQDQIAFGLPSGTSSASSGYTTPAEAQRALDCLIKSQQCGNYQPAQSYTNFRGLMTWSINWDAFRGFEFSNPHRAYLDQNP